MRGKILTLFLILLAALLFPYMSAIVWLDPDPDTALLSNGREVILENGASVPAESYLIGVLAGQIDPEAEPETLKAQAVLARTWLYRSMGSGSSVSESALSAAAMSLGQMESLWKDRAYLYYEKLYAAVAQTVGQCLYDQDEIAVPLYTKISAGQTRSDITGSCPYLISVDCFYDAEAKGYQMVKQMTGEELKAALNGIDEGRQLAEPVSAERFALTLDGAGYVLSGTIDGITFTGEELQQAMALLSPWFRLEDYAEGVRIISKGQGHGFGMSQYGANRYAKQGRDYIWILQYYFHDISIKTV